jgi:signal transduction histidine kinase
VGEVEGRAARELAGLVVHPAESADEPELAAALAGRTWRSAKSAAQLRGLLERGEAGALVLDVSAAGQGALDILRERRARGDGLPALVIAAFGDVEAADRARALGGCLTIARESATAPLLRAALAELAGPTQAPTPVSASLAPAMLWKADARGDFTHFTHRLLEFLGQSQTQAAGRGWFARVHPEDQGALLAAWADLCEAPREIQIDLRVRARDAYRWVRLDARPGADGFVGSLFAIDDLVAARDAARDESGRLEAASRELEELAFAAAHDLQEPLRSVERELGEALRGEPADLGLALRQASRMRSLLRDLVDYAGSTQSRVAAEASELGQSLEWALENLRGALADSAAEVKVETLARALADPIQIARVFQNLVSNAVRFRAAAPPRITVGAEVRATDVLVFVRDNGIGIAPSHHETVFRVFERLHGGEREGSGMGLAICRRIVEQHGGRIWVESELGQGATFYFTVPSAAS